MRYILAIAVSILLAAIYASQNAAEISVRFFMFEKNFQQGIWEAILFSTGAVIMWFFSVLAAFESYSRNRKVTMDLNKKIASLEEDKKSLLETLRHLSPGSGYAYSDEAPSAELPAPGEGVTKSCTDESTPQDEPDAVKKETVSV
jgi:uncharacterized membrane protein YciS (DUF1049 family)